MSTVDAEGGRVAVLLSGGSTLRRLCLAQFLELSGISVGIVALENGGKGGATPLLGTAADLALIDTGEKTCSDPGVKKIFDDLRGMVPSVPIVVISDREDGLGGGRCHAARRARLFPVQPRPENSPRDVALCPERRHVRAAEREHGPRRLPVTGARTVQSPLSLICNT
jgi:hypothetical protein